MVQSDPIDLLPCRFCLEQVRSGIVAETVFHAHIHLIPRRDGDTPHPRGGVRGVIPHKMNYPSKE